jgi:hypothetical protein
MNAGKKKTAPKQLIFEQYKTYFQDLGNIGLRHENTRRFYLSVLSVLFVFLSMAGENGPLVSVKSDVQILVGIVGVILCSAWFVHMRSFGSIFLAKFKVLREIEKQLGLFHVFDREYKHLKSFSWYNKTTVIDSVTPGLFVALFIATMYFKYMV